jgi:hypothetical protein
MIFGSNPGKGKTLFFYFKIRRPALVFLNPHSMDSPFPSKEKERGVKLITKFHILPKLRMLRFMHPLPLYPFVSWTVASS